MLAAANPAGAHHLLVAIPEAFEAGQIVEKARSLNPSIEIIARGRTDAEVQHLMQHGANLAIMGEREIALGMLASVHATSEDTASTAGQKPSDPVEGYPTWHDIDESGGRLSLRQA